MKALIDADQVAIASAFVAENDDVGLGYECATNFIETILKDVDAAEYELWLSGGFNFRYDIYPDYKVDRKKNKRPKWEQEVKDFLIKEFNANVVHGMEADDMLGIRHSELTDSILCHRDKDLNQIKGLHYNWEIKRLGEVVREKRIYTISDEEGDYWFFHQLLTGDSTDSIPGLKGIGPKKAAGILYGCETNQERYEQCLGAYNGNEEELDLNANLVYIWRKHEDHWKTILNDTTEREI